MSISRLAALIVAALGLILLAPTLIAIALLVRISSRGPLLVQERRQRSDGTNFSIIRFRTNGVDSNQKTGRGGFLRASGLDRLPTLVTLLQGEVTLSEFWNLIHETAA
jgi:lipopolysaccharide/colanic/teichoic acid biosynthesis glycosyltransferase